MASKYWF